MKRHLALLLSVSLMLSACGYNDRMQSAGTGAAIGAGTGLAAGFVCCKDTKDAAPGLFIGMAVGALIGYLFAPGAN